MEEAIELAQEQWEDALLSATDIDAEVDWNLRDGLVVHHPLDGDISGVHAGKCGVRYLTSVGRGFLRVR